MLFNEVFRATILIQNSLNELKIIENELWIKNLIGSDSLNMLTENQWKVLGPKIFNDLEKNLEFSTSWAPSFDWVPSKFSAEESQNLQFSEIKNNLKLRNTNDSGAPYIKKLHQVGEIVVKLMNESQTNINNRKKLLNDLIILEGVYSGLQNEIQTNGSIINLDSFVEFLKAKNETTYILKKELHQLKYGNDLLKTELQNETLLLENEKETFQEKLSLLKSTIRDKKLAFQKYSNNKKENFEAEEQAEIRNFIFQEKIIEKHLSQLSEKQALEEYFAEQKNSYLKSDIKTLILEVECQDMEKIQETKKKLEKFLSLQKEKRELDKDKALLEIEKEKEEFLATILSNITP